MLVLALPTGGLRVAPQRLARVLLVDALNTSRFNSSIETRDDEAVEPGDLLDMRVHRGQTEDASKLQARRLHGHHPGMAAIFELEHVSRRHAPDRSRPPLLRGDE